MVKGGRLGATKSWSRGGGSFPPKFKSNQDIVGKIEHGK